MLDKLGIYVCPEKGCPAIGKREGLECPRHNKPMIREIYVRSTIATPMQDLQNLMSKLGEKRA